MIIDRILAWFGLIRIGLVNQRVAVINNALRRAIVKSREASAALRGEKLQ